jgi:hypothetical protein
LEIVLNLKNIKIPSINNKFGKSKQGTLFLNKDYANFKKLVESSLLTNKVFKPPYQVVIVINTYLDIDNSIKCILDGISRVISNDKDILQLDVIKIRNKRGRAGSLIVSVEEIDEIDAKNIYKKLGN